MKFGLMMECDYREGRTQSEAFDEAFTTATSAEEWGFDGVWLAERHFAPPGSGRAIPSVVASPLIFATAIAARTSRIRVGTAVLVLPLGHPVRMAEEVATLDNISQGRLDLGIGRSGFPWAYDGYDIPYSESRERFMEYFQVMKLAWTEDRFSYQGEHYNFQDVCLIPKPYQQPHPPLRYAASTRETFADMGRLGIPIFAGLGWLRRLRPGRSHLRVPGRLEGSRTPRRGRRDSPRRHLRGRGHGPCRDRTPREHHELLQPHPPGPDSDCHLLRG